MKTKTLIVFFTFFILSLSAQQQRPRIGLEQFDTERILTHLTDQLSLSDEQIEEIKPVLENTQIKLNALKNKSYSNDREMMEEHRSVMDENAELIEQYLTEEQIEKFRELRSQRQRFNNGDRPRMGRNRW